MADLVPTIAFIDGLNLYHAIRDLGVPALKWLNVRALVEKFAPANQYSLKRILYFTAYPTWKPDPYKRHRDYVTALESTGIEVIKGNFKEKPKDCRKCGVRWVSHEEKETDVNVALALLDLAYAGEYERGILLTADSDLAPAVRAVLRRFPRKQIHPLIPPGKQPPGAIARATPTRHSKIKLEHLERSLFPERWVAPDGTEIVRPLEYQPRKP